MGSGDTLQETTRYLSDHLFSLMVSCLLSVLTLCDLVEKANHLYLS